ncbi:MAG: GNAT family N-acetyltransferase, partial [Nitrososphaeraceae archaeon]|nr:GNAT family N-acetyltransferase [Nitrososphaeraceae archaeon]
KKIEDKLYYEVAYSLLPKFWGKGYATEIAKHIRSFGQEVLGIKELISIIHQRNTDSAKVAIKNDMVIWKHANYKDLPVHVYRYRRPLEKVS